MTTKTLTKREYNFENKIHDYSFLYDFLLTNRIIADIIKEAKDLGYTQTIELHKFLDFKVVILRKGKREIKIGRFKKTGEWLFNVK